METPRSLLHDVGLPPGEPHGLPSTPARFAGRAQHRVEIPRVEGPAPFSAVIDIGQEFGMGVNRFGLCNATDSYSSGLHLEQVAVLSAHERFRRAALGRETLRRHAPDLAASVPDAEGLGVPVGIQRQPVGRGGGAR